MKAKLLRILLAVAIATGSMTACKKKSAAAPATGKESTAVDTTMKEIEQTCSGVSPRPQTVLDVCRPTA